MPNKEPGYGYILTNPSFRDFIPASSEGTQALYDGITFEKDRSFKED